MIWLLDGAVSRFDPETETFTHFHPGREFPHASLNYTYGSLYEDRSHNLWVATLDHGVFKLDLKPHRHTHYRYRPGEPNSLSDDDILSIHESRTGKLWILTSRNGVSRFDPMTETFEHFQHDPEDPQSLSDHALLAINEDQTGTIWLGSRWTGVSRIDPITKSVARYQHQNINAESLPYNGITSIQGDRLDNVWIGTYRGSFIKFDQERKNFAAFYPTGKESGWHWIGQIYEDRAGRLWVCDGNLYLFDQEKTEFTLVSPLRKANGAFGDIKLESKDGTLWGGNGGLLRLDPQTMRFKRYRIVLHDQKDNEDEADADYVYWIHENTDGTLWCATTNGLHKFDPQKGKFVERYFEREGLPSEVVYKIIEADDGSLWLKTPIALCIFREHNSPGEQFETIGIADGIVNSGGSATNGAFIKSRSGEIYWGGTNGIYRFHTGVNETNPYVPPRAAHGFSAL